MVAPYDYLDSMAWTVGISAILIGIALLKLRYNPATDSIEDDGKKNRLGFSFALGGAGLYLFITGLAISLTWPLGTGSPWGQQFVAPTYSGGQFNVLFGGIATLGGLLLVAVAVAMFYNAGFSVISYFAAVAGAYGLVDAAIFLGKNYTKTPWLAALGYIGFAAAAFLTVPATHSTNPNMRKIAAIFAFLFAAVWLIQGLMFTTSHSGMPLV